MLWRLNRSPHRDMVNKTYNWWKFFCSIKSSSWSDVCNPPFGGEKDVHKTWLPDEWQIVSGNYTPRNTPSEAYNYAAIGWNLLDESVKQKIRQVAMELNCV